MADVKEKEVRLAMTLVLNGWDSLLVEGNAVTNSLEFNGIENWATNLSCSMHTNSAAWASSGTFAAATFDRWQAESCAKPTTLFGHPQAMQEVMSAYFALGFNGSQVVNFLSGDRIVPTELIKMEWMVIDIFSSHNKVSNEIPRPGNLSSERRIKSTGRS